MYLATSLVSPSLEDSNTFNKSIFHSSHRPDFKIYSWLITLVIYYLLNHRAAPY